MLPEQERHVKPDYEELRAAALPMIEYIKKYGCPHTTAIITDNSVKLVSDEIGIPDYYSRIKENE